MPRPCDTCRHARAREIDAELRRPDRTATFKELGERFGLKPDAIERHHANHMQRSALRFAGVALLPPDVVEAQPVEQPMHATAAPTSPAPPPPAPPTTVAIELTELADWSEVPQAASLPQEPPTPPVASPEPDKPLTLPQQKTRFLELLAEFGSIGRACREVGIPRSRVNKWLEVDELFGFAYHQAQAVATERLEEVARERATRGARYEKQVWRQGRLVETTVEYRPSDTALITLLKAQKPDTYRERIDQNVAGEVSVRYTNDWRAAPAQPAASPA